MGFGKQDMNESESSTEDLTKNFDSSLRLSSKFSSSRFSPYSRTSSNANSAASRRSLETATERSLSSSERVRRRRHRSEPNPTEEKAVESINSLDRKPDKKQLLAQSSKVAKSLKVTASCSIQSQRTTAPPPEEALFHATTSDHEEVNVNELAAYLENSVLIPRKMSSMAETIYG